MIRDETSVVRRLTSYFDLSDKEARTYIKALVNGSVEGGEVKSLQARGMLIRSSDEKVYLPVHPRLALSNLFRLRGDKPSAEKTERRKLVDKLTLELMLVHEGKRDLR